MAQWFMALLESVGLRIFSQVNAGNDDALLFSSSSEAYADDEDYLQPSGRYRDAVRTPEHRPYPGFLAGGVGRSSQLSAKFQLPRWASSWTLSLVLMSEALSATQRHLRGTPAVSGAVTATTLASDDEPDDGLRLARFADASASRMLEFADAVAAVDLKHRGLTEKLLVLLNLHAHVSKASEILLPSLLDESGWLAASRDMMRSLVNKIDKDFSARKERLGEVIWSVMMQDAKALISSKDSWDTMPQDGEIHETTELTMEFAPMLRANESVLNSIVWRFSVSWHQTSTANIIADLIGELEEQLEAESESSLDPSVRYIFLLNNCDFIEERLALLDFPSGRVFGTDLKLESYFKNYTDSSWEPVLSCLQGKSATTTWFQIQKQCSIPAGKVPVQA